MCRREVGIYTIGSSPRFVTFIWVIVRFSNNDPMGLAVRALQEYAPADSLGSWGALQRRKHIGEAGLSFEVRPVGELPGESTHVEVPAFAGDGLFPAGGRRVRVVGDHLRMMTRRNQVKPAWFRQNRTIVAVASKWVATGGFPTVVGVGQLCPPLMMVAIRKAAEPRNSWTTTWLQRT